MNIPLDRLYHFIDKIAEHSYGGSVIIYRFWPNGSKKLENLSTLHNVVNIDTRWKIMPLVVCHDQEPLDYEAYNSEVVPSHPSEYLKLVCKLGLYRGVYNLNNLITIFDKSILIHSEKRSKNLEKYLQAPSNGQSQQLSVYYWSHAIIARDWYRYAQHERFKKKNINKKFLIYNRAWSGTREYRLKFTDLLIQHQLIDQCKTYCSPVDNEIHYSNHRFTNTVWQPTLPIENHAVPPTATSSASADFDRDDYCSTEIEVVLETLFDDDRLHLTEKSLRPIACKQPFILAATHGSLQYLKDYGFKTFDSVWDENYDTIEDPYQRMLAIIELMKNICAWTPEEKISKMQEIENIVSYNQTYFFSQNFFLQVTDELKQNLDINFAKIKNNPGFEKFLDRETELEKFSEIQKFSSNNKDVDFIHRYIDSYPRNLYQLK